MKKKTLLVLGGARSGKSRYAEQRVMEVPSPWTYLATAQAFDDEMVRRIADHRARRSTDWQTVECPFDLATAVATHAIAGRAVLVDCLTLWLSNLLIGGTDIDADVDADVDAGIDRLVESVTAASGLLVLVSNEVGLGIVPDNALARRFRDQTGWLHQRLATLCDEVVLMVAGIPMRVK